MEPTIGRLAATIPIRPAIRTEAPAVMRRFGTLHASAAALFVAVIGFPQRSTLTPDDPMRACGTTNRFAIVCAQKTETTLEFFHPRGSSNSQGRALTMHVISDKIRARAVSPGGAPPLNNLVTEASAQMVKAQMGWETSWSASRRTPATSAVDTG